MRAPVTWVLVADAAEARLLRADRAMCRLEPLREMRHDASRARASELMNDRQGRSFDSNRLGGRHAMEPGTDPKLVERRRFARQLAAELELAMSAGSYERLVLVAPPRMLGELRKALPERVAQHVERQLGKDLTHLGPTELEESLGHLLWP